MIFFLFCISVAELPLDSNFYGARAVSSVSGQGAIVQFKEHFYQLEYKNNKYSWTILPQKWKTGVESAVMMTLPDDYTC